MKDYCNRMVTLRAIEAALQTDQFPINPVARIFIYYISYPINKDE